ncbi:MAG: ATP-binding protein [Kiloniellaceae bacterium]
MRRFLPASIVGRMILVLLLVLTVSQVVSTAIHYTDRADALTILGGGQVAERIATIARLVDETPPAERPRILDAVDGPTLKVSLSPESLARDGGRNDWHTQILEESLKLHLSDFNPARIRVQFLEADEGHWSFAADARVGFAGNPAEIMHLHMRHMMGELALGRRVRVSVRLSDASWLNFATPVAEPTVFWSPRFLISMAVMVITVVVASIWAVRRSTAPLRTFARAADRLGRDVHAPPLPERGPSEVRHAIGAFNRMQERIRRFVDDRVRMVAAISHDLRTPITRLRLRAEFVDDEEQRRKMLADLEEMENMIATTLAYAREDAGNEPMETVDLAALLQSVCDAMADTGSRVSFESEGRVPCRGRPVALRRAFSNLIDNAVKYGGSADVGVETREESVVVRIDDKGPGIAVDEQDKVFEPFYRVEGSRSRETGGAGLGLTVARNIIRAHGGDIALRDRSHGGLRVEVVLPR